MKNYYFFCWCALLSMISIISNAAEVRVDCPPSVTQDNLNNIDLSKCTFTPSNESLVALLQQIDVVEQCVDQNDNGDVLCKSANGESFTCSVSNAKNSALCQFPGRRVVDCQNLQFTDTTVSAATCTVRSAV